MAPKAPNYGATLEPEGKKGAAKKGAGKTAPAQQVMADSIFGSSTSLLVSQYASGIMYAPVELGVMGGKQPIFVKENSSFFARCCMGKGRGAKWQVFSGAGAADGRAVYQLEKGAAIGPMCPCLNNPKYIVHELAESGEKTRVGAIVSRPRFVKTELELRDEEGHKIGKLTGSQCQSSYCCPLCGISTHSIAMSRLEGQEGKIATMSKFGYPNSRIEMPAGLTAQEKILVFSAYHLTHIQYLDPRCCGSSSETAGTA